MDLDEYRSALELALIRKARRIYGVEPTPAWLATVKRELAASEEPDVAQQVILRVQWPKYGKAEAQYWAACGIPGRRVVVPYTATLIN